MENVRLTLELVSGSEGAVVHLTEQFAVPSTVPAFSPRNVRVRVLQAVIRRHVSFRGVGEQQLTTRIQPSFSEVQASPDFRLWRIVPLAVSAGNGPDERNKGCQEQKPAWATLNQPSTIGRVREPWALS